MILTHNEEYAHEARIRRNQGESGKYLHSHLGTNARMTDISAGIGLAQKRKLNWMLKERNRVACRYDEVFESHSAIEVMCCRRANSAHAYFFYPILVNNRDDIVAAMKEKWIDTRIAYPMPVYEQKLYCNGGLPCRLTSCPVAEEFTKKVINLPIFPSLTNDKVDYIAKTVLELV